VEEGRAAMNAALERAKSSGRATSRGSLRLPSYLGARSVWFYSVRGASPWTSRAGLSSRKPTKPVTGSDTPAQPTRFSPPIPPKDYTRYVDAALWHY
jgi:hypothetical protein